MITFTPDSLFLLIEIEERINFSKSVVFINIGDHNYQIEKLETINDFFEVNGTYQSFPIKYILHLRNSASLEFSFKNGKVALSPFRVKANKTDSRTELEVSPYAF